MRSLSVARHVRGNLRRLFLGISPREATFARRGFAAADDHARIQLEAAGTAFVRGYNAALLADSSDELTDALNGVSTALRGFAFEGAAMGLTIRDLVVFRSPRRVRDFLAGPGQPHRYMVHVGVGWACARMRRDVSQLTAHFDQVLSWLIVDGYGFHEGYFHPRRFIDRQECPGQLTGYARRAFDQGLGRSIWFAAGGDARTAASRVHHFPDARRADLWSGIGLACAYAGGPPPESLAWLRREAGTYAPELCQGVIFAATARHRAGNMANHTAMTCALLCDMSPHNAAQLAEDSFKRLPLEEAVPAYEIWRRRVQSRFSSEPMPCIA